MVVVLLQAERELPQTDRSLVEIFGSRFRSRRQRDLSDQQLNEANTQLEDRGVAQRTRALMQANPQAVGAMAAAAARQSASQQGSSAPSPMT